MAKTKTATAATENKKKTGATAKPRAARKKSIAPSVLYISAEVNPFSQTGGLGEVASSLPVAVNAMGGDARMAVVTPLYECVGENFRKNFEFICHINVPAVSYTHLTLPTT